MTPPTRCPTSRRMLDHDGADDDPRADAAGRRADSPVAALATLASWPARRWFAAALASIATALVMGIPTGIIHTSIYTRMTPVTWWDYPVWAISSLLAGLVAATYVRRADDAITADVGARRSLGATLLATFAVGCPICNKLVVGVLGVGGALSIWAPMQPVLGVVSIVLLATGLVIRLRGSLACPAPTAG